MMNLYQLLYSEPDDILTLYKMMTKSKIVDKHEGRYGVVNHRDVRNNIMKIEIPNPSFVLSLSVDDLTKRL